MASHLRLIRPAGTLAKGHSTLLSSSNLPTLSSVPNGCTVTLQRPVKAIFLAKRAFSTSLATKSNNSNNSGSKDATEKTKAAAVSASEVAEEEAKKKVVAEAEKKRIEAQDAALKEILESAAAEKRKLEQEAIKVAEEKARKAAALEAEAAARARAAKAKAEAEAAAKAKQDAERQEAAATDKSSQQELLQKQPYKQHQHQPSWSHSQAPGSSNAASNSMAASSSSQSSAADSSRAGSRMSASAASQHAPSTTNGQAKEAGSQSSLADDPLEPFKAKLLPYKRSLESSTEYIRSALPDSLRQLSESVKRKDYHDTIALLAGHLNTFTGYNAINELKHKVITHGDRLDEARIKLVQAKQAYEDAIGMRSDTQKAINDLLQRKHLWSPDDVIRFTDLYRSEHANEQAEQKTKAQYKQAESEVEERSRQLTTVITERYHEEQVWSDKIRAASTYGTWGLIGVNVMAFLVVQAFVEPRRRRKQVERYEELVQDLTERGILPNQMVALSTGSRAGGAVVAPAEADKPSAAEDGSESVGKDSVPVAVGGALLGGEDVLSKIIQSAERQEERLDRMETLLKQLPGTRINDNQNGSAANFVVAEDGSILFMPEDDNNEPESVEMAKAWREEIRLGSRSGGGSEGSRISQVLKDGGAEVPATRRDFLLSGLGGAILGGLVTVVVMMNC
ncbi:sensitivity to high expression protein she9 [Mortierella alpina]|nr:sensitivity to high expression protein she9 [Mortierella alpina]